MAIDRGLNTTVSTNPLGIDDDDYNATTRGPQGIDGASTQEYIDKYNAVLAAAITTATNATNAATSEANASANAVSSAVSELAADTSETNAAASETAAALSETNAGTSETNAATSASQSASSAANALSSKNAASGSETNAASSATSAASSASTATAQASTATTKASEALASQTAAAASETSAATSATTATTQASIATTKASEASASAVAAASSESASATSETNAATSATTASTKASEAATSETNAATSATTALNSLAASASNAAAAAVSATAAQVAETAAEVAEVNAETAETAAELAETHAETAEAAALVSQSAAAASQSSATASASSAAASASSSSSSASDAQSSEDDAATSETNAANSASASATSAVASSTSASNSATSATASATSATQSATSATNAATSATSAAASLASFTGQYVSQPTAPSSPSLGDLWFDETADVFKVYTASGFVEINSSVNGVEESIEFVATSGQTTYSFDYDVGNIQIYLNGIRLDEADYTATDGTSVVLDVGATLGDTVFMQAFGVFQLADVYNKAVSDARFTTEAYVDTEIAALVDSSPATLDTLNELAAALGDDPNFATTVTNSIATKLPLAGGTLTGDVSHGDNVKAKFGNADDLQVYHDGSHSYVNDTNAGNLYLKSNGSEITLRDGSNASMVRAFTGGAVRLYNNGSEKLATTSTGVDVTGTVTTDGVINSQSSEYFASQSALVSTGSTAKVYATNTTFDGTNGSLVLQSRPTNGADVYVVAGSTPKTVAKFFDGGDVQFMEDTGTTPKFFWDSSAESLGIGTVNPATALDVVGTVTADGLTVDSTSPTLILKDSDGAGTTASGSIKFNDSDNSTSAKIGYLSTGNSDFDIFQAENAAITMWTNANPSLSLGGNGDLRLYNTAGSATKFLWDASAQETTITALNNTVTTYPLKVQNAAASGRLELGTYGINNNIDLKLQRQGSTKLTVNSTGVDVTGNITVSGTVDGRDIATDGTKLNTIETGATADQTAAQLLTAVKTVDGSGSGLDADLLDGQQGSYYYSSGNPPPLTADPTLTLTGDVTGTATFTNLGNATLTTVVANNSHQHSTLYENSTIDYGASQLQWTDLSGTGGTGADGSTPKNPTSDWYHHIITNHANNSGYYYDLSLPFHQDELFFRRVTAGVQGSFRKVWHDGNDGSGSGLDADLLDGQHASAFLTPTGDGSQLTGISGFSFPTQASLSTGTIVQNTNGGYQSLYLGSGGAGWYYFQDFTTGCLLLNVSGWKNDSSNNDGLIENIAADTTGIFYCTGTPRLYSLKWGNNNNIYTGGSIKWVKIG